MLEDIERMTHTLRISHDNQTKEQIQSTSAQEPRSVTTGASAKESSGERLEINSRNFIRKMYIFQKHNAVERHRANCLISSTCIDIKANTSRSNES